jgi:hypothetical protein
VIEAAIEATRTADKDLVPVATRLLGRARHSTAEAELRVGELIRNESPEVRLAAVQSASALGMPLTDYGAKISKLLDIFAEDALDLISVIGNQGRSFEFMVPKICEHITRAIREMDDELAMALLDCLQRIGADPQRSIEKCIRSPEIRREALHRLSSAP